MDKPTEAVYISHLRKLTRKELRKLDHTLMLWHKNQPLAAIVPYAQFMAMQAIILAGENTDGG